MIVRDKIRGYIRKRTSGEVKSDLGGESDVLSLLLNNKEVFGEEDIIDELIDFMVAATQTTQLTSQYSLAHLMTDTESLKRVRAEFNSLNLAISDGMTLESCSDLTYLGYVIQEALRLNPVAPMTSPIWFEKDTKIGNLEVKAHEIITINITGLHLNASQW